MGYGAMGYGVTTDNRKNSIMPPSSERCQDTNRKPRQTPWTQAAELSTLKGRPLFPLGPRP
eukprot:3284367-Pyramimonas_sp.AAC.2